MPPLDGDITKFVPFTVSTAKPFDFDAATPDERLLELASLLENPAQWSGRVLVWDFGAVVEERRSSLIDRIFRGYKCDSKGCALGLAASVWPGFIGDAIVGWSIDWPQSKPFAMKHFNITEKETSALFGKQMARAHGGYDNVGPAHVAVAIRDFVAKRSATC